MCLSRAADKIAVQETDGIMEEISGSDHPSTEQFNMLLNLLPAHTLQQVRDIDSLRYFNYSLTPHTSHLTPFNSNLRQQNIDWTTFSIDEADILMAAVNYILSLTSQLQHKLRWGNNNNSFLSANNNQRS